LQEARREEKCFHGSCRPFDNRLDAVMLSAASQGQLPSNDKRGKSPQCCHAERSEASGFFGSVGDKQILRRRSEMTLWANTAKVKIF